MNKKTQSEALGEVLKFLLGIVFLAIFFFFLYEYLVPQVESYALGLQLENTANHASFLISKINSQLNDFYYLSMEYSFPMPEKLGEYAYTISFSGNLVCASIPELGIDKCAQLQNSAALRGIFFSGQDMIIRASSNESHSIITLSS